MQQINLLPSRAGLEHKGFALRSALILVLVCVGIMSLASGVQWWLVSDLNSQKEAMSRQQQDILLEIQTMTSLLNNVGDDGSLKSMLVQKEQELDNKKNVLQVLSGQKFGNTHGFANHFTGLSRQHIEGMWLTQFMIYDGGDKVNLKGSTYQAEQVPKYLINLSQEKSFTGVEFRTFLMQRYKNSNRIDFDIRSSKKENDDAGNS